MLASSCVGEAHFCQSVLICPIKVVLILFPNVIWLQWYARNMKGSGYNCISKIYEGSNWLVIALSCMNQASLLMGHQSFFCRCEQNFIHRKLYCLIMIIARFTSFNGFLFFGSFMILFDHIFDHSKAHGIFFFLLKDHFRT